MSNVFTLDDLNKAIDAEYGPFVFQAGREKFTLQQVLRLPKEKRDVVRAQLQLLDEKQDELEEADVIAMLKAVISNVMDENKADRLFEVLDNDLLKIKVIFEQWIKKSQPGEA